VAVAFPLIQNLRDLAVNLVLMPLKDRQDQPVTGSEVVVQRGGVALAGQFVDLT